MPNSIIADIKAYYLEEIFIGVFISYQLKKYNYAAHIILSEKFRCKGYGQKIITEILFHYSNDEPFLGYAESPWQTDAPNLEMRKRRHAFYLRISIKDTLKLYNLDGVE